jgi:hypothetical protein
MRRHAITTLLLGIVPVTISLSACATTRQLEEIEALVKADEKVFIAVRDGKIEMVHPGVKESCSPRRTDCGEQIRWKVVGPIGDQKIHVEEKAGGSQGCFTAFDLHQDHREEVQTPSRNCQQEPTAWYYDVVLRDAGGTELHKVDPLVFVSWSRGP